MDYKTYIKTLMKYNNITYDKLAVKMTEETGKKYTRASLNGKFARDKFSVSELVIISKILNFKIKLESDGFMLNL